MSHFSVIVETAEYPTDEVLMRLMQPYHEFECTGIDDRYIQEIDQTAEAIEKYKSQTSKMVDVDGELIDAYDDRFYREPTDDESKMIGPYGGSGSCGEFRYHSKDWNDGRGYRAKVHDPGDVIEVPVSDSQSFLEFAADYYGDRKLQQGHERTDDHKYGFIEVDENDQVIRIVKRTNPNKRWDYWRIGGRYTGKFWPKSGKNDRGSLSWEWKMEQDHEPPAGADICQVSNLDFERMKQLRMNERRTHWEESMEKSELTSDQLFVAIKDNQAAYKKWLELPEPRPRGGDYHAWSHKNGYRHAIELGKIWDAPEIRDHASVEEWIEAAQPLSTFAFVDVNGKWFERGKMGWWACVSDEQDYDTWCNEFNKYLASVNPDHWLTVLDCHI